MYELVANFLLKLIQESLFFHILSLFHMNIFQHFELGQI
jgi:hypothetical protein